MVCVCVCSYKKTGEFWMTTAHACKQRLYSHGPVMAFWAAAETDGTTQAAVVFRRSKTERRGKPLEEVIRNKRDAGLVSYYCPPRCISISAN